MAQQLINLGTPPTGLDGDDARTAFEKVNLNFTEVYGATTNPKISAISASVWAANQLMYTTGEDTVAMTAFPVLSRSLLALSDLASWKGPVGLDLSKADVGLSLVDNTSDANKPISTAQAAVNSDLVAADAAKVPKADIVDNVTTDDATKVLSAKQGKFLYELLQSNNVSAVAYKFITTAGQTTLTGLDSGGKNLVYTPGAVMLVTGQGFDYWDGYDYTATDGTSIVFTEAFVAGEEIGVVVFGTFSLADHYTKAEDDAKFVTKTAVIDLAHGGTGATSMGAGAVGTVSQAAGIPTGAVIEYQTNANGSYVKWADGTMIAWRSSTITTAVDTALNGGFYSASPAGVVQMPATFAALPRVWKELQASATNNSTGYSSHWGPCTVNSWAGFYLADLFSRPSQTYIIDYFALGRWF